LIRTERPGGSAFGQSIRVGIAAQLYLSESSVEKHVNAIFTKLGLSAAQLSYRRVTAVLTFLRRAGLRGRASVALLEQISFAIHRGMRRTRPPEIWQLLLYRSN